MPKGYQHLTREQRCQFATLKERGDSIRTIAATINVHTSTLYRELNRNEGNNGYNYQEAHTKASNRRSSASQKKTKMTEDTIALIHDKLELQWSPEQIAGWLKRQGYEKAVCYETIYQYVWKNKQLGGNLYNNLRHRGKKYNKRSKGMNSRGCIPNRLDIDKRPAIVQQKGRLGDWELDTIIGKGRKGAIVSMVERKSRLTKLGLIPKNNALEVSEALFHALYPMKLFIHTLTSDNGKEFAYHEDISLDLGAGFYFAKPYHPWERGLNEHTNGLVRQYFPKSMYFNEITPKEIEKVEFLLNNRPRKVLNFSTPLEVFNQLADQSYSVALHS